MTRVIRAVPHHCGDGSRNLLVADLLLVFVLPLVVRYTGIEAYAQPLVNVVDRAIWVADLSTFIKALLQFLVSDEWDAVFGGDAFI